MYERGYGVTQDDAAAVGWFRRAAEQGEARAQHDLGVMYADGQGVPVDSVRSHMWLSLAVKNLAPGQDREMAVENRNIIAKKMTPADISKAQRLAREWTEKHGK